MESGIIVLWNGAIVDIPNGFVLCDGNNGTPDLTDMFVVGAGSTYAVNATGGDNDHSHPFTTAGHTHTIIAGANIASGANYSNVTGSADDSGNTGPTEHLPPYYALAYIMKT